MYAIDLHTHSTASHDGGLRSKDYEAMLQSGRLDGIAVTDHNRLDFAQELRRRLGDRIIVGEEISTDVGDVIGLYLDEPIPAGLSIDATLRRIHAQGGLVYVPHPFERTRKGVSDRVLTAIQRSVDILEIYNGRAVFSGSNRRAAAWAHAHQIAGAASSDAHGWRGWGRTYTSLTEEPTKKTLPTLLATATYSCRAPGLYALLYPKLNRWYRRRTS